MLVLYVVTLALLASPAVPAPTTSNPSDSAASSDGDLDTSETGHFRRKRIWKKLAKQLSDLGGYGQGGLGGLGGYGLGLGGLGVDFLLNGLGNIQKHHHHSHNPHGGHGSYGTYPVGHHDASHYGSPNVGIPYGGYAPGYSYTRAVPSLGYGHGASLGHSLAGVHPDLALWDASLAVHHDYGWGPHSGLDFGGFWI